MMRRLLSLFLLTLLLATASCKKSGEVGVQNEANGNASVASADTSSTPPFATKEPERYQATRIITTSESAAEAGVGVEPGSRTLIARDGERRREDYESSSGEKISYLQLPEAMYVLLPAKKLYAELKPEMRGADGEPAASLPPDFSPDKLLNETRPESHYEKLGTETVGGRAATKYRVITGGKTGAAKEVRTETIVWVDESLGMPIKTETTSTGTAGFLARVTMELRDIKETVDAGMLELPSDYRKVETRELFAQTNPASPGRTGRE